MVNNILQKWQDWMLIHKNVNFSPAGADKLHEEHGVEAQHGADQQHQLCPGHCRSL